MSDVIESALDSLVLALSDHNHLWTQQEREGYEAARKHAQQLERLLMDALVVIDALKVLVPEGMIAEQPRKVIGEWRLEAMSALGDGQV
jgi:hypothetical protein